MLKVVPWGMFNNLSGEIRHHRLLPKPLQYAEMSDVVIMCLGLSPEFEGEEGSAAEF